MHKFRELKVWQRAMDFAMEIYRLSADFPKAGQFGLTSQTRRATASIAPNIAEGAGSISDLEFQRFLGYALRSTYEVTAALEIGERLGYLAPDHGQTLLAESDEIAAMLVGLSCSLDRKKKVRLPWPTCQPVAARQGRLTTDI